MSPATLQEAVSLTSSRGLSDYRIPSTLLAKLRRGTTLLCYLGLRPHYSGILAEIVTPEGEHHLFLRPTTESERAYSRRFLVSALGRLWLLRLRILAWVSGGSAKMFTVPRWEYMARSVVKNTTVSQPRNSTRSFFRVLSALKPS